MKGTQLVQADHDRRRARYDAEDCDACAGAACDPPMSREAFGMWRRGQGIPSKVARGKPCPKAMADGPQAAYRLQADLVEARQEIARLRGIVAQIVRVAGHVGPPPAQIVPPAAAPWHAPGSPEPPQGAPNPPVSAPAAPDPPFRGFQARPKANAPAAGMASTPSPVQNRGAPGHRTAEDLAQNALPNLAEPLTARQRGMLQNAALAGDDLEIPEDREGRDELAGLVARGLARLPPERGARPRLTPAGRSVAGKANDVVLDSAGRPRGEQIAEA